jgi:hypothetical protein
MDRQILKIQLERSMFYSSKQCILPTVLPKQSVFKSIFRLLERSKQSVVKKKKICRHE